MQIFALSLFFNSPWAIYGGYNAHLLSEFISNIILPRPCLLSSLLQHIGAKKVKLIYNIMQSLAYTSKQCIKRPFQQYIYDKTSLGSFFLFYLLETLIYHIKHEMQHFNDFIRKTKRGGGGVREISFTLEFFWHQNKCNRSVQT